MRGGTRVPPVERKGPPLAAASRKRRAPKRVSSSTKVRSRPGERAWVRPSRLARPRSWPREEHLAPAIGAWIGEGPKDRTVRMERPAAKVARDRGKNRAGWCARQTFVLERRALARRHSGPKLPQKTAVRRGSTGPDLAFMPASRAALARRTAPAGAKPAVSKPSRRRQSVARVRQFLDALAHSQHEQHGRVYPMEDTGRHPARRGSGWSG